MEELDDVELVEEGHSLLTIQLPGQKDPPALCWHEQLHILPSSHAIAYTSFHHNHNIIQHRTHHNIRDLIMDDKY